MIELSHILFSYSGLPPWVLDDVSLSVPKGSYISILGENGSGKSTLMRMILGFVKPIAGHVRLSTRRIGYVPQRTGGNNSDFPITVFEMMDSYRRLLRIHDPHAVRQALSLTRTEDLSRRLMGTLSGGQRQRVLIARALLGQPDLLLLDEPSTGVDVPNQNEIYRLLSRLHKEEDLTILSIEHNLPAARTVSDALFVLKNGKGSFETMGNEGGVRRKE